MIDLNDIPRLNRLYEKDTFVLRMVVYGMKTDRATQLPLKAIAQKFSVYFTPNGRLSKILSGHPKKFEALFGYNHEGQLVRKTVYDMEQEILSEEVYEYNENGDLYYTRFYTFGEGEPAVRHRFTIAPENTIHEFIMDEKAEKFGTCLTHELEYDEKGREITRMVYEGDDLLYGYTQELNDDNKPALRLHIDKTGQPCGHTYYDYNGLGELVKKTTTMGEEIKVHDYKYCYHARGHWNEIAHLCNGELLWITEREVLRYMRANSNW